jgi:hypothetical protein
MGTSSNWPFNGLTWPWNINSGIMTVCFPTTDIPISVRTVIWMKRGAR